MIQHLLPSKCRCWCSFAAVNAQLFYKSDPSLRTGSQKISSTQETSASVAYPDFLRSCSLTSASAQKAQDRHSGLSSITLTTWWRHSIYGLTGVLVMVFHGWLAVNTLGPVINFSIGLVWLLDWELASCSLFLCPVLKWFECTMTSRCFQSQGRSTNI